MKKLFLLMIAALAVSCGSCWGTGTAEAKETELFSRGVIVYRQNGSETVLSAGDLIFLRSQLSTMPEYTFNPAVYARAVPQTKTRKQIFGEADENDIRVWGVEEESDSEQACEPAEKEQEMPESEGEAEMPLQTETEEETETAVSGDLTASPGEEAGTDTEVPADPAAASEENTPEEKDGEGNDTAAPEDTAKENLPGDENKEEAAVSENTLMKNPPETGETPEINLPESGDIGGQIITEQ